MYSEQNQKAPQYRANDAFLRRMLGGELTGNAGCGCRDDGETHLPEFRSRVACDGARREDRMSGGCGCRENQDRCSEPRTRVSCENSRREDSVGKSCGCGEPNVCQSGKCMPSLAMVYAPVQSWSGVLDPVSALKAGSQFSDLILPFEGYSFGKGGKSCF